MTKKIIYILYFLCLLNSCKKVENHNNENESFDRLHDDSLYEIKLLGINFPKSTEHIELYINRKKDTILNQYKLIKNKKIDTLYSQYYDLWISETEKPNIYNGTIKLHTLYENLKLDKKNKRRIEFTYCQQNKDSIYFGEITSKTSTTLHFKFENFYNKTLQGILFQVVERDTTKGMINLNQIHLLVDNKTKTDNLFLESYDLDKDKTKKVKLKGVKLKKM